MQVNIVFGPPGTGKTTELMKLLENELASVAPENIAYVSFTKEGANQGKNRAIKQFGFVEKDFPYFRTLHSIAFRALDLGRAGVISKEHYKTFSGKMGMNFTGYYTEDLRHDDDMYLFYDELFRNNAKAANVFLNMIDANKLKYVRTNYAKFKKESDLLDFTDMIERFVEQRISLPVTVAFIDEAQDLTTLQWKMVWTAFRNCERVYIAGDDDQAIYQWSGADVNYFLGIEGNVRVLKHSYRLPDPILRYAKRITKQIGKRVEKDYEGLGNEGYVDEHNALSDVSLIPGESYMFLSRNNAFLDLAEDYARAKAVIYSRKGKASATKDDYSAIALYEKCRAEGAISQKEVSSLSMYTKRDFKLSEPWYASFSWDESRVNYFRDLVAKKVPLSAPLVRIGTIHSAKGAEAEHAIVMFDITKNVLTNLQNNPDSEHRVFYVGCTRAKKSLHVIHSNSRYGYTVY